MNRGPGFRFLALSAGLALLFGCNDDGHDGGAGTPGGRTANPDSSLEFFDDFSGSFPGPNWETRKGDPFTSPDVGNAPPGLALLTCGKMARVRTAFTFSASKPLTLTFELANPEWKWNSRFKFKIRRANEDSGEASFEIRLDRHEIRLGIEGSHEELDYASDGAYHEVGFTVDAGGTAAWWIDGQARLSRADFPGGEVEIELEATGGHATEFVVDNVTLTRP
jgi:hypothetical protein